MTNTSTRRKSLPSKLDSMKKDRGSLEGGPPEMSRFKKKLSVISNISLPVSIGEEHGLQKKIPTTYMESMIHFLKGNIGSGVFAMSEGFKNVGIVVAPILTVVLGFFCIYGEHLLLTCAHKLKEKHNLPDYPPFANTIEMGFASGPRIFRSFSKYMLPLVNFFIVVTHLGFCCVYYIFISSTSQQVMAIYGLDFSVRIHMVLLLLPLIFFTFIRQLKYLVPLSLLANLCMGFGIISTVYLIGYDLPPISSRTYVGDWKEIPLFFGTVMYSFEGIGLVLPLKTEMKKPKNFDSRFGVLNVGMFITITVFTLFGFIGYLKFGDTIQPSITLSLDPTLKLSIFVKIAIAIGILFSYCLMFYVAMIVIWPLFNRRFGPFEHPLVAELSLRVCFVFLTFVLAEVVPHLGLFISLIGAFSTTGLAVFVPPLCDISLRWPSDFGKMYWRFILDIITLILGVLGFVTGTYYSLAEIYKKFSN